MTCWNTSFTAYLQEGSVYSLNLINSLQQGCVWISVLTVKFKDSRILILTYLFITSNSFSAFMLHHRCGCGCLSLYLVIFADELLFRGSQTQNWYSLLTNNKRFFLNCIGYYNLAQSAPARCPSQYSRFLSRKWIH